VMSTGGKQRTHRQENQEPGRHKRVSPFME
jgi:hypothetical protein